MNVWYEHFATNSQCQSAQILVSEQMNSLVLGAIWAVLMMKKSENLVTKLVFKFNFSVFPNI